jgi:hypothetical protein
LRRPSAPAPAVSEPLLPFPERPAARLLVGPPGSGKTHEALAALDAAVEEHGADRAVLLLPTYGDVEHARRVALSRRDVGGLLDAPFATFTSLPERWLGTRVAALPSRAERDLLAGEALRGPGTDAFARVRHRKGFRARFLRLVKEMKQTGEDPAAARQRGRALAPALSAAARERWEGFLSAWERYDALLGRAGIADHEDVLRALLARIRADPPEALSRLAFLGLDGFDDLTGLEEALFRAAASVVREGGGAVVATLLLDDERPELFRPTRDLRDRLVEDGFGVEATSGCRRARGALAHLAASLFGARTDRVDAGAEVVELVGADPADELERIGREIRRLVDGDRSDLGPRREGEGPLAFRDVGIVFRRLDAVGAWAQRTLEGLGVPTRLAGGHGRLASEAVVRVMRGPWSVMAGAGAGDVDLDAARVLDWLRWRALASGDPVPLELVDAADMRFREAGFPSDWHAILAFNEHPRWRAELGALDVARVACAAARGPDAVWAALLDATDRLLPLGTPSDLDDLGRPRDPEGDERLRRSANAKRRLLDVGRGLRAAARRTGLFPDLDARAAVAQWLDALEEATCPLPDRRLEAVTLLDAEEARHYELPVVFVAGLVAKEFPLQPREDVFLRDDDRAALAAAGGREGLRTARAEEERERRLLLQAVTRARRRLYLCRHAADADGRDKAPSLLWREVADVLSQTKKGRAVPFGSEAERVRPAEPGVAEALTAADLERWVARRLGEPAALGSDADRLRAVAILRAGADRAAAWARRAGRFRRAREDALAAARRDVFLTATERVSPTGATMAHDCLHRFFLSKVLRVPQDDLPVSGKPFDLRGMGTLAHQALRLAVVHPDLGPAEVAAAALAEERDAAPPADTAAWDAVAADLARVVALFRLREARASASGFAPAADRVEIQFGGEGQPDVWLGEGEGRFRLHGKIDRVDVLVEDGGEAVALAVDYKLGKTTAKTLIDHAIDLEDLQLPLYARAIEEAFGWRVVGLEGYAASRRSRNAVFDVAYEERLLRRRERGRAESMPADEFRALLTSAEATASRRIAQVRRGGDGGHGKTARDGEVCDGCAYRAICRPDVFRLGGRSA